MDPKGEQGPLAEAGLDTGEARNKYSALAISSSSGQIALSIPALLSSEQPPPMPSSLSSLC